MTRRLIVSLVVCLMVFVVASPVAGQNPFTGKKEASPPAPQLISAGTVLTKLALWQFQVREKMAALVAQAKQEKSLRPLALLILLAFFYGVLHAAGPGHGKAIAVSYMITRRPGYAQGLLFGVSVALIHGLMGVVFVLIVGLILQAGISGTLGEVTTVTQIASYSLIILMGLTITVKSMMKWRARLRHEDIDSPRKSYGNYLGAAFAIGMIPCPGVVMVALFSVSMGLIGLGVILGVAISLGMALTITIAITVVVIVKKKAFYRSGANAKRMITLETVLESCGGLLLTSLGLLFLSAAV